MGTIHHFPNQSHMKMLEPIASVIDCLHQIQGFIIDKDMNNARKGILIAATLLHNAMFDLARYAEEEDLPLIDE